MHSILIKLHPMFLDKLLQKVQSTVYNVLDREQYLENVVENDE